MKLHNLNSCPNFTSIYKFNIERSNHKQAGEAIDEILNLELENRTAQVFSSYTDYSEACKTGIFERIHVSADDEFDEFIESILKQRNVKYAKQTKAEVLEPKNIYNRIVMPRDTNFKNLVALDTKKIEDLFKENDCYISENITKTTDNRFQCFKDFLLTGRDIEASQIVLREHDDHLTLNFIDGRHRFCVMRDMGLEKIKFATDENSLKLAHKYNLVAQ